MIKGAKFWDDREHYYTQSNNPTESLLRKRDSASTLESCGPTAAVNCLAVLGHTLDIFCPGSYSPQPEEVLLDYFNDPRNADRLQKERADISVNQIPPNREPQFYPLAVREVFGAVAHFAWLSGFEIRQHLEAGRAIQILMRTPSHYVAVVAYDSEVENAIINDPWPEGREDGTGFNIRVGIDDLMEEIEPFAIVYEEPI